YQLPEPAGFPRLFPGTTHAASNLGGLSSAEAEARLKEYGPNVLPEKKKIRLWRRFAEQFRSALIYILLVALVIDLFIWLSEGAGGVPVESLAIALILLLNAGLAEPNEEVD